MSYRIVTGTPDDLERGISELESLGYYPLDNPVAYGGGLLWVLFQPPGVEPEQKEKHFDDGVYYICSEPDGRGQISTTIGLAAAEMFRDSMAEAGKTVHIIKKRSNKNEIE